MFLSLNETFVFKDSFHRSWKIWWQYILCVSFCNTWLLLLLLFFSWIKYLFLYIHFIYPSASPWISLYCHLFFFHWICMTIQKRETERKRRIKMLCELVNLTFPLDIGNVQYKTHSLMHAHRQNCFYTLKTKPYAITNLRMLYEIEYKVSSSCFFRVTLGMNEWMTICICIYVHMHWWCMCVVFTIAPLQRIVLYFMCIVRNKIWTTQWNKKTHKNRPATTTLQIHLFTKWVPFSPHSHTHKYIFADMQIMLIFTAKNDWQNSIGARGSGKKTNRKIKIW